MPWRSDEKPEFDFETRRTTSVYLKLNLSFVLSLLLRIYLSVLLVNNDDIYQVHVLLSRAVLSYWLNTNITLSRSFEMCRRNRSCQSILSLPSIRDNLDYSLTRNRRSLSLDFVGKREKSRDKCRRIRGRE